MTLNGRLRWKRDPQETGLRSIGAGPRGYKLHDGADYYASVSPLGGSAFNGPLRGWYWSVPSRDWVPYMNTCQTPCQTVEEAKKQARAYIDAHLKASA